MRDQPPNVSARRKRRLVFAGAVAVVVLAAALTHQLANRGPSYEGKSINYWFRRYPKGDWNQAPETAAFRAMGESAAPFLKKMLREDTWWEQFYRNQYRRLPLWLRGPLPIPLPGGYKQTRAAEIFRFIGPPADAAAVPDLIETFKNDYAKRYDFNRSAVTDWASPSLRGMMLITNRLTPFSAPDRDILRRLIIEDLGSIGSTNNEIIPVLIAASREPDNQVHFEATQITMWGNLTLAAKSSTGVLIGALNDPDAEVRQLAAHLLRLIIAENSDLIAPLIRCLSDTNAQVYAETIGSLTKAPRNQVVHPLIEALKSTNARVRSGAAFTLENLGPVARAAVPKLQELSLEENEPEIKVRRSAAEALWKIDHQLRALIPFRIEDLKDKSEWRRWDAATFLGECGRVAASATPALAELLLKDENNRLRGKAAIALGQIGPQAKIAIPALKQALQDEQKNVRDAAAEALKKIDPAGGEQ